MAEKKLEIKKQLRRQTKKEIKNSFIDIPADVKVTINNKLIELEKSGIKQEVSINPVYVSVIFKDNKIEVIPRKSPKRYVSVVNTTIKNIKNAIEGFTKEYTYKLAIVYSHFPITVKVEGSTIIISNFLGEKKPRKTNVLPGCKVVISGKEITVTGRNKHNVGLTAGNIERTARVIKRDYRVFDDGCYIVQKNC